jgi:hypothetical protein
MRWFILADCWLAGPGSAAGIDVSLPPRVEVVVTGIPRPIQLALDAKGGLVVLGQGWRGDAAGEIYRIDPRGSVPVDATRLPRVVIPFAGEPRKTTFGSLAVDPGSGDLFLGEENGNRIYRFADQRLQVMAGLNHSSGQPRPRPARRLVFIDYASPETHSIETPLPPHSVAPQEDTGAPWFSGWTSTSMPPRAAPTAQPIRTAEWTVRAGNRCGGSSAWRRRATISSWCRREVLRLGADGALVSSPDFVRHYHRTNLAIDPTGVRVPGVSGSDRSRIAFGGISIIATKQVIQAGSWTATRYIAETALHRILSSPAADRPICSFRGRGLNVGTPRARPAPPAAGPFAARKCRGRWGPSLRSALG